MKDLIAAQWSLVNMVEEELSEDEICRPRRPGHVLFPEVRNVTSALSLCQNMKALISVVTSREQQNTMDKIYRDFFTVKESESKFFFVCLKRFKSLTHK